MVIGTVSIGIALLVVLNLWVSWRVRRDELSSGGQKLIQLLIVWLVPIVGALLALHVQRRHGDDASGEYPGSRDLGDDFGLLDRSNRSLRHVSDPHDISPDGTGDGASSH